MAEALYDGSLSNRKGTRPSTPLPVQVEALRQAELPCKQSYQRRKKFQLLAEKISIKAKAQSGQEVLYCNNHI
jgi:hypothetical protein